MRKLLAIITLFAVSLTSEAAVADDTHGVDLSVFATYWDADDGDDNVWGPGFGIAIPVWEQQLKFDMRASWLEVSRNENIGDISLVPLDIGLSLHQNSDSLWDFYAMGGMSVLFSDVDENGDFEGDIDADDSTLGAYVGGGVRYDFAENLGLFTNVYYRFAELDVDTESVAGLSSSEDFSADGLNVDVGLAYTF